MIIIVAEDGVHSYRGVISRDVWEKVDLLEFIPPGGPTVIAVLDRTAPNPCKALAEAGFKLGDLGPTGWTTAWTPNPTTVRHGPGKIVHVYHAGLTTPDNPCDLLGSVQYPWQAETRLHWWLSLTGQQYHGTPGLSALDSLRTSLTRPDGRHPAPRVLRPTDGRQRPVQAAGELVWRRPRTGDRTGHRWDMRAAYLAAAASAELGWGAPRAVEPAEADGQPGWYRVVTPAQPWTLTGVPIIDPARIQRDRTAWVTLPTVDFLREIGHTPEVVEAIVSPTGGRLLRTWAEHWRDVLAEVKHDHAGRPLLKLGYVQAIGMLGRPGGLIERPDWHDTIRAQARVSVLRRINRVGQATTLAPVSVQTDAIYYAATITEEQRHEISMYIGQGERMGNMVYEGLFRAGKRVR